MDKVVCMPQELNSLISEESGGVRQEKSHYVQHPGHHFRSSNLLSSYQADDYKWRITFCRTLLEMWWCQTVSVNTEYVSLRNPWTIWLYWSPVREKNDISCLWECHTVTENKKRHPLTTHQWVPQQWPVLLSKAHSATVLTFKKV